MHLDREHEAWLDGESGPSLQWAMEVLVELARRTGADRMVPLSSAHIPGWCGNGHEEAWKGLEELSMGSSMPVTANPSAGQCIDERRRVLERLRPGHHYSFSCAPYLSGNHPARGQHVAWGGRAATAFANSVLGARSEMESLETAAAAAIARLTPLRGLHLEENRQPTIAVQVPAGAQDHALLGWTLSRELCGEVPLLCGARLTFDEARRFAFALNSRGSMPLFRLRRDPLPPAGLETIEVRPEAPISGQEPDLVVLGCPHLSEQDINRWAKRMAGRSPTSTEAWFFTSRLCMDKCPIFGAVLRSRGSMFADTCPLGMAHMMTGRSVACDSPALADCLRGRGIEAFYSPDEELLAHLVR